MLYDHERWQKGLNHAIERELPSAAEAHFTIHIKRNLVKAYGTEVEQE